MARDFSKAFYASQAWKRTEAAYMESVHHVCERCGRPAAVVHHKRYLTPDVMGNPEITLGWDNLEALCLDCHNREHFGGSPTAPGLEFGSDGQLRPSAPRPSGTIC